jgi:hypothetical protein
MINGATLGGVERRLGRNYFCSAAQHSTAHGPRSDTFLRSGTFLVSRFSQDVWYTECPGHDKKYFIGEKIRERNSLLGDGGEK